MIFLRKNTYMDADKSATRDPILEQTLIKNNSRMHIFCGSKGFTDLDVNRKALSIQLYNTSSFRTSIELFTNSLDGEEKTNFPMPKELTSRTSARRVAWLRKVCKIQYIFFIKLRKRKIQIKLSGLRWNLERWVLDVHKWQWVHHNPLYSYLEAIAL